MLSPALEVTSLSKAFPGQQALSRVSLVVGRGEIHALVGHNGSGKSTLVKALAGYEPPDSGEISVAGVRLQPPYSPPKALSAGICCVHQDLGLVPALSVMDNLALSIGFPTRFANRIDTLAQRRRTVAALAEYDLDIPPSTLVSDLPLGERTMLAIVRAFAAAESGGKVLILDEASAGLAPADVATLHARLRDLASRGIGILYISHRLEEVLEIADRVTVLRDGEVRATLAVDGVAQRDLLDHMFGQVAIHSKPLASRPSGEICMRAVGLSGLAARGVSFDLHRGEVLGITALLNPIRRNVVEMVLGLVAAESGTLEILGSSVGVSRATNVIRNGLAYVPADRPTEGAIGALSVRENMTLASLERFWRRAWFNRKQEREVVGRFVDAFKVRPPLPEKRMAELSGGNQQKVVIARAVGAAPVVLVLEEPTHGVDARSRLEIYAAIERIRESGTAIVLVTMEVDDLLAVADRILVLGETGNLATLSRPDFRGDLITSLAGAGGSKAAAI